LLQPEFYRAKREPVDTPQHMVRQFIGRVQGMIKNGDSYIVGKEELFGSDFL